MAKGKEQQPTAVHMGPMTFLPPAPDRCQTCASKHAPGEPHNAQSLYYQMTFRQQHGRWPMWRDALAHCDPLTRSMWRNGLLEAGVPASEID